MARQRVFKAAITNIGSLNDTEIRELVLNDGWRGVNSVIKLRPTVADLQRLMVLELTSEAPRQRVMNRLREGLQAAMSRRSIGALDRVMACVNVHETPLMGDLQELGLGIDQSMTIVDWWKQ